MWFEGRKWGLWTADSALRSLANDFTFRVNSRIEKDGETVGFFKGEKFMSHDITIVSSEDGSEVASMRRNVLSLSPWTWEIERMQPEVKIDFCI